MILKGWMIVNTCSSKNTALNLQNLQRNARTPRTLWRELREHLERNFGRKIWWEWGGRGWFSAGIVGRRERSEQVCPMKLHACKWWRVGVWRCMCKVLRREKLSWALERLMLAAKIREKREERELLERLYSY